MPTALAQARAILADPAAYAHRPSLIVLAYLVDRCARGQTPRQSTPQFTTRGA